MKVDINVHMYSGLEVHCVRPCYKQNDFVIGFSLHPINPNERDFCSSDLISKGQAPIDLIQVNFLLAFRFEN